jgi:putative transposase
VNHEHTYRLYRSDGLSLRLKKQRRHVSAANRERQPRHWRRTRCSRWILFRTPCPAVAVTGADRRRRLPPRGLAIEVDRKIEGEQLVETIRRTSPIRGAPKTTHVDGRLEFISKALDR